MEITNIMYGPCRSGLPVSIVLFSLACPANYALAQGSTLTVPNLNDSGSGSLREAIKVAAPGDTIAFGVTGTIGLSTVLLISKDLNIKGPGPARLAISGSARTRVFEIATNANVSISGLTICNGHAPNGGGWLDWSTNAMPPGQNGGGIHNLGRLALADCSLSNNNAGDGGSYWAENGVEGTFAAAGGSGGALWNEGIVSALNCAFFANSAGRGGDGGKVESAGGYFSPTHGEQGGAGGAIYNSGSLFLTNCTISGNAAGSGGGGGCAGPPWFGSAMGGNGGGGGGICNSGNLILIACTLAANSCGIAGSGGCGPPHPSWGGGPGIGGDIYSGLDGVSSARLLNTFSTQLAGAFASLGHNLICIADGSYGFTNGANFDLVGTVSAPINPELGELQDNGGPTPSMALLHGSPALGAGDDSLVTPPWNLAKDQRGLPRKPGGMHIDIGAFAFQPIRQPPVLTKLGRSATGELQFTFNDNTPGATFSVISATNISSSVSNWVVLGQAKRVPFGGFQFSDFQITNRPSGFYRVSSP